MSKGAERHYETEVLWGGYRDAFRALPLAEQDRFERAAAAQLPPDADRYAQYWTAVALAAGVPPRKIYKRGTGLAPRSARSRG